MTATTGSCGLFSTDGAGTMNNNKLLLSFFLANALYAAPVFAQCTPGPYVNLPVTTQVGAVTLAQLGTDSSIYSPNGVYRLLFQGDGNLVLFQGHQPIWSPNVQNCIPTPYYAHSADFQSDGNFVIYYVLQSNPQQKVPIWSTNTQGNPGSRLEVQNDGNVVIYDRNNRAMWDIRR